MRFLAFSIRAAPAFSGYWICRPTSLLSIRQTYRMLNCSLALRALEITASFGLVQRRLGIEPLSFLRFSGQPLDLLVKAIDDGFAEIENPANVEIDGSTTSSEYSFCSSPPYGIHYHTFIKTHEIDAGMLHQKQMNRIKLLRRLLLEGISEAARIYVFKRNDNLTLPEILPLFAASEQARASHVAFCAPCR